MSEPIRLIVYRREGRLWVGALAIARVALQTLNVLRPAAEGAEGLAAALNLTDERVHREIALPIPERFRDGIEFWRAAGCKTWPSFVRGTTSCKIVRWPPGTTDYWVPNPETTIEYCVQGGRDGLSLVPTDIIENHPRDISYEDVARAVLRIFATYPPEMKVPVRSR